MAVNTDLELGSGFEKTFNSFSGTDILAVMGNNVVGELQGVSFTVTREKAPLYVMGRANPISYSRGKRGIAGSLIFLTFDNGALIESIGKGEGKRNKFFARQVEANFKKLVRGETGGNTRTSPRSGVDGSQIPSATIWSDAWYVDQLPPFNIILVAENEYGGGATMSITGTEILNSGSGVSVDDITTDEQMTFVALDIRGWRSLVFKNPTTGENVTGGIEQGNELAAALIG